MLQLLILLEVVVAALLGAVIGIERERRTKPAGLRTHMLVAASACLLTALGSVLSQGFIADPELRSSVMADPIRIIQAIIVGISFIGAGTIIQNRQRERVQNLTTAASILFTASMGITVGSGLYVLSIGLALLGLGINFAVGEFERRVGFKEDDGD